MKIRVGQVFRVPYGDSRRYGAYGGDLVTYQDLTRGTRHASADVNKGIWAYRDLVEPGATLPRTPAVILHSNPLKEDSEANPWIDVVEPDRGYAAFNGDNRSSARDPFTARGNALLLRLNRFYVDPELRQFAPPVLLFTQHEVAGNRKGYRAFSGFGVPTRYFLRSQREKNSDRYFTNLAVELALFRLDAEDERFDWRWIDQRRDSSLPSDEALRAAPESWRMWVKEGTTAIERCRRVVSHHRLTRVSAQLDYSAEDRQLLEEIHRSFSTHFHAFEGFAALIAERVVGPRCLRAWVTPRTADGGVDFVCRLDLGTDFSQTSAVVLGQAKCLPPAGSVNGRDVARLVARLRRGWFGAFVTTGAFSVSCQREILEDRYPVVLVNGKRVAREVRQLLNIEGLPLASLLEREKAWYEANRRPVDPERVLDDAVLGSEVTAGLGVLSDPPG